MVITDDMTSAEVVEINEVFDLASRFITETAENIFLTGKAGTGKTTFLKYIEKHCPKNLIIAAPTGVAAINAGGVTIHSLFQLPFHPILPTRESRNELVSKTHFTQSKLELLRKLDLLILDEVSMIRADVMDGIDVLLRHVRRNYKEPFGGVQMLFIGDLYQLPPVTAGTEWQLLQEYYASPFFFDSLAVREQMPLLVELNKIYRQKEAGFVDLLNKIRNNVMQPKDYDMLHSRLHQPMQVNGQYITLTSHNRQANEINERELNALPGMGFTYTAYVQGEFSASAYPAEELLVLKEGAQVMFLKNDPERKFFNGKIGIVHSLTEDEVFVNCDNEMIEVPIAVWDNNRYSIEARTGKMQQEHLGSFSQLPLRLAWAVTIHKSQGLTFNHVMIDAGQSFSSGQVYVALSRCTSLEGIILLSKIPAAAIMSSEHVSTSQNTFAYKGNMQDRFATARLIYIQSIFEYLFCLQDVVQSCESFQSVLEQHNNLIKISSTDWLMQIVLQLKQMFATGKKFTIQLNELLKSPETIENNTLLQQRIISGAAWFTHQLDVVLKSLNTAAIATEKLEVAEIIDKELNTLVGKLHIVRYLIGEISRGFSLQDYHKARLSYTKPRRVASVYKQALGDATGSHAPLLNRLLKWRQELVQGSDTPLYMIANKQALETVAEHLPLTKQALLKTPGFGKAKVSQYGDDILQMVQEYCDQHNLQPIQKPEIFESKKSKDKSDSKKNKTPTAHISLALLKEGKSLADIAANRNYAVSTIKGHMLQLVKEGLVSVNELFSETKIKLLDQYLQQHHFEENELWIDNLPETVTADEFYFYRRVVLATNK